MKSEKDRQKELGELVRKFIQKEIDENEFKNEIIYEKNTFTKDDLRIFIYLDAKSRRLP